MPPQENKNTVVYCFILNPRCPKLKLKDKVQKVGCNNRAIVQQFECSGDKFSLVSKKQNQTYEKEVSVTRPTVTDTIWASKGFFYIFCLTIDP